jgi:hypothetical protein
MRGALAVEDAVLHQTLLRCPIALKTFLINCGVLAVIVRVHLNVTRANVGFITFVLNAVIVRLLSVVLAEAKLNGAIVG